MRIVRKFTVGRQTFGPGDEQAFLAAGHNVRKYQALHLIEIPRKRSVPVTSPKTQPTRRSMLDELNKMEWPEVQKMAESLGLRPHGVKRVKLSEAILDEIIKQQADEDARHAAALKAEAKAAEMEANAKEAARLAAEKVALPAIDHAERRAQLMEQSRETLMAIAARYDVRVEDDDDLETLCGLILEAEQVAFAAEQTDTGEGN